MREQSGQGRGRRWASGGALLLLLAGCGLAWCGAATAAPAVAALAPASTTAASAPGAGWTWPVGSAASPPTVSRRFDPPATRYGAGHRGVDLVAAAGSPVVAAGRGRVTYAGLLAGRAVVVVDHGALRTTYEPVDALVAVGDSVATGEAIGILDPGHLGCPAAACLHWGLRRGEEYLDPLALVGVGPVRLLPLTGTPAAGVPAGTGPAPVSGHGAGAPSPGAPGSGPTRATGVAAGEGTLPQVAPATAGQPPSGSLPRAAAGVGSVAVMAAGLGLLVRRRPGGGPPPGPAVPSVGLAAGRSAVLEGDRAGAADAPLPAEQPDATVVDLDRERARRTA